MFDFRYHALSLVAVFLALAVGLLLGVAIGDRGLVSSAEKGLRDNLQSDVQASRQESRDLQQQLDFNRSYEQQTYPDVVRNRLQGRRVAVVFTHGRSDAMLADIGHAIDPSGARLELQATLRMPVNLDGLATALADTRYADLADDPQQQRDFARRAGEEVVQGGGRLIEDPEVRRALFTDSSGAVPGVEGVVLVRSDPGERPQAQADSEDAFERAFVAGMRDFQVPVVGVETTSTDPSQVGWYKRGDLASVDNVDQVAGWSSLVLCLAGAQGAYGTKSSRDSFLPQGLTR